MTEEARLMEQLRSLVRQGALRWLHSINLDRHSETYGVCDREYWAWKLKDFANGTHQAGLAGFLDAVSLLGLTAEEVHVVVGAVVEGSRKIQREDGSFEEAYPYESSYCVTALVQFGLLYSRLRYPAYFTETTNQTLHEIIRATDRFLAKTPETHGIIANHLCTGLVALHLGAAFLRHSLAEVNYTDFVDLQHPHEGWFPEYGAADPGYQSLLNHYLAAANLALPLPSPLLAALEKSRMFVSAFTLPNGSFAGEIGGRGTAIYYPGGGARATFYWFLTHYLDNMDAVTPVTVDAGNFVPVFNSWALAFCSLSAPGQEGLSFVDDSTPVVAWPDAGLYRLTSARGMVWLSVRNGAIRRVIRNEQGHWEDVSLTAMVNGQQTTQRGQVEDFSHTASTLSWSVIPGSMVQPLNTPMATICLRVMGFFLHPFPKLHRGFKKLLAGFVMGRSPQPGKQISIRYRIDLTRDDLPVQIEAPTGWQSCGYGYHQHMASANTFARRALRSGD
jgi:hypothetical protein